MSQKEDEPLEDHVERFQFSLKKNPQNKLFEESLKLVFFRGVNEDCMYAINLIVRGDVSQLPEEICRVYKNYSRTFTKKPRGKRTSTIGKSSTRVSKIDLSNFFSNMKEDIINHLSTQLETLHIKKKQEEVEAMFIEYCPDCRQRKVNCKCKRVVSIQEKRREKPDF